MAPGLGSFGNASIDQWDVAFVAASEAVFRLRAVRVDPRFLKAMMEVESGGDGFYPASRCRPCDGQDCVPACGPMQIKRQFHQWRCPECNFGTVPGQIELAAHILGMPMKERGWDEYRAFLAVYFPADDPNGTTQQTYVARLRGLVHAMQQDAGEEPEPEPPPPTGPLVRFAGAAVAVPLDVPFRQVLLPRSQTNQRPGTRMAPALYVQHETGNPRPGADAEMHRQYLFNGAEGQQLGYHLTVDKDECIQMVPLDEIAWHGGDGSGQCNMRGIACELTVEDNNRHKVRARANAEKVAAAAMTAMRLTRLEQHNFCSGKNCPEYIRRDGYWPTFKTNVQAIMAGGTTPPPPPPAWEGLPDWLPSAHLLAAFPGADPTGKGIVTKAVVAWAIEAGRVPIFRERREAGPGKSLWLFDGVAFLHDGTRVWREGEVPA